ncbi:MAG: hypothetical protein ACRBDL_02755 [Alphaproteobacteria bacterium]
MIKNIAVHGYLMFALTTQAYAAGSGEDSHHGHEGHHEVAGLPQLDPSSFVSQTFWLILVFAVLYIFFAKKSLPAISQTIESRAERIQNDLDSAQRLKEEVETVQSAYEENLSKARAESANLFTDIEDDIKRRTEQHSKDFQDKSAKKIEALEKSILESRDKVMDEMSDVAADVAAEAAEKIIGVRADADSAKAVVKSLNKAA